MCCVLKITFIYNVNAHLIPTYKTSTINKNVHVWHTVHLYCNVLSSENQIYT